MRVDHGDIAKANDFFRDHFGDGSLFNVDGWKRIVDVHGGRLPLTISAVEEGTTHPTGTPLMVIENTDPELPWLTNYVETLLCQIWYPCTIATQSRNLGKIVGDHLRETGDISLLPFKVHDFGYRGSTSEESAGIGAAAHLLTFLGTDTLAGIEMAKQFYSGEPMAGFSIPAAEHSTITAWGYGHEIEAFAHMLKEFPTGLVAVVSDSYDVFAACRNAWGRELRDRVLARDGTLVIRPDSGDPVVTVLKVLAILGEAFGTTKNDKGFFVLDPHVRVLQGDGIDHTMILRILSHMIDAWWSADNIAFGSGGGLLQKVNRDTLGFALKCSAIEIDGQWREVYKDPVTDPGKRSKAGRQHRGMVEVFRNGELLVYHTFEEIRDRMKGGK
jgi:nicotinamide phosphoribosyltransferase